MFICMQKINFISKLFLRYCEEIANLLFCELWECLIIPIKIITSICWKLSCLSACKKSTSLLTSFLKYCKEIENSLFWVLWACLGTHTQYDIIILEMMVSSCLYLPAKNQFHPPYFSGDKFAKLWKLLISGTLDIPGYAHRKWHYQIVEKLDVTGQK